MLSEITVVPVEQRTLADYTRPELVAPQLRQRDTAGIISELCQVLQAQRCVADVLPFYHTTLNHELLSNSALECGIALPHGRLSGVKHLQFAFGRTPEPVIWGSKGSCRVQLIFLLAVPATDAAGYLHLLASVARLAQQPDSLAQLRLADTPQAVFAVLQKIRLRS
ncbi:MAG TPA: PTS sugar transporter subunit IIA [Verrucomicrobiae bacterium]|nr:PTS sugar transporter subunit IIA [Verrucomicrobiae bacterium]